MEIKRISFSLILFYGVVEIRAPSLTITKYRCIFAKLIMASLEYFNILFAICFQIVAIKFQFKGIKDQSIPGGDGFGTMVQEKNAKRCVCVFFIFNRKKKNMKICVVLIFASIRSTWPLR